MKKAVIVMAVVLLMICLSVWALGWEHETTGHLIVSFRDMETGGPITNVTVTVKTLNCIGPNAGVYESHYTRTSAMTDSNGVADVEFLFLVPDFDWSISRPSGYYTNGFGIESECFGAEVEPSDYEDIDETTPDGAAKAQQIQALHESGNWLSLWRLFGPKNVTYTNTTIRRSVGFYPKRNPRPMYVYAQHFNERLPTVGENIMTNGLVAVKYPTVGVDVRCGTFSVSCQDSGSGQTGDVVDFTINRYSVVTNGVKTFFGCIDFQAGCGAYKRSKMNNTSFGSTYCAETNAMLLTSIPYEYSNVGGRFVDATMLVGKDEYMVMRTRVATDDSGVVTNCNYSKIEGPMWVGGGVLFDCLVFNPRPNDPNLEPGENLARQR